MKTLRTVVLVLVASVVMMTHTSASGLVGIYGIVERVTFEGTPGPLRAQVWGAFAFANGGVGNVSAWSPVKRGYLYFRLPDASVASAADMDLVRREWSDLKSVAGTGQVVAFGRWGYIGRFDDLLAQPSFLERRTSGGNYTDLRVRGTAATPEAPAPYQTNAGVVRIPDGSHADLVQQLRAAVRQPPFTLQTGPPMAAMPDPATPGVKKFKDVAFVVRSAGCADVSTFRVSATAHGTVGGVPTSMALRVLDVSAGVFALAGHETAGTWVVSVAGTCGRSVTGATVRMINGAYRRDTVELLPHHPAQADVDRAFSRPSGSGRP